MALVYIYNKDVVTVAFISELQPPFYKHLLKNDITKMREIIV